MSATFIGHVVATETDPSKGSAEVLYHQETIADGTSQTTDTAYWTYRNFVNAALYNSTLNLVEATFKLKIVEPGATVEVVLYDDSNDEEEPTPEPTLKRV